MKNILILGGAGYIGSVLTDQLLREGAKVVSLDNFAYGDSYAILNFLNHENYKFIYGDLTNELVIDKALNGISDVIILAGMVGDPITKKYPDISHRVNDLGIFNLFKACNGKKLNRLIFVSTCSNYGFIGENELADENFPLNPLSLYSKSKVNAERYILGLKGKIDYCPTVLRFATAFGLSPRMRFDLTISEFTKDLAFGKELLVYDPDTWRPYCHVKDFSRLIAKVLEADRELVEFEVFNAGGDANNFTKRGIVELISQKILNPNIKYLKEGSDPRNYRVSFKKVKETLDFEPRYSVSDGINELLNAIENRVFDNNVTISNGNYEVYAKL